MSGSEANLSQAIDDLPIACLVVESGTITRVNPLAPEVMGIPTERMVGVALAELLVPEYEQACSDLLARADEKPESAAVRLAAALAPIELTARSLSGEAHLVAVRSMADEYRYSAQAGGPLTHDAVTGLPSHYQVLSELHTRLSGGRRQPTALLCLWIDELPELAESHGNRAIQRVMKEVGSRIEGRLRSPDTVGRYDEAGFLVVMTSDSPAEQLTQIAERLRGEVAFPVEFGGGLVSFTASIVVGKVSYERPSIERILALLEAAANRAVTSGGDRTEVLAL